jgi:hypothetical protein
MDMVMNMYKDIDRDTVMEEHEHKNEHEMNCLKGQ